MNNTTESLRFKTNINCSGCVAKVSPLLNEAEGISQWSVDTGNKDKILTVQTSGIAPEGVIKKVQEAGFKIEQL
ncbi:MAG: heavy-metal-associated domain-containing protein [Bacteroidetes bacterium]|nr:heavy-metal-associated domain-containing protein [Bacteroidota bacterium]